VLSPTALPWRRPRHELLLLALVSVAALSPVQPVSVQDWSRMCQTQAFVHARLTIDDCIGTTIDRSRYHGRLYSNKAPGMSLLAIPGYEAVRLPAPTRWSEYDRRLWLARLATSGICFVLCAFLVGRIAEGLAVGWGGAALVALSLGTLASSFAPTNFDHVPAMGLGFAAFVLAWSRRPLAAGLVAGLALLVEYEAAAIGLVLAAYLATIGRAAVGRFLLGLVPGAALLAAYDWAAFGAPWHNPLSYSDNRFRAEHAKGLLGIHPPNLHAIHLVFVGQKGLLVSSPVLVAGAYGLWLLWRRGVRAEALACAAIVACFLVAECGYFDPYGGASPGVRFFVPALPFLAVGFAPAFARLRLPTAVLAAASVVASTAVALTWANTNSFRQTIWGEIARVPPQHGGSLLVLRLVKNGIVWHGPNELVLGAAIVCAAATGAFALAAWNGFRQKAEA
jgi:hypothetical protein